MRPHHARVCDRRGSAALTHDASEAAGTGLALRRDGPSLVALDLRTGHERWRVAADSGQIVAGGGSVAAIGSTIRAFDAPTGACRRTAPAPSLGGRHRGTAVIGSGELILPVASPFFERYDG